MKFALKTAVVAAIVAYTSLLPLQLVFCEADEYFMLDTVGGGCMGLKDGSTHPGNKLMLLECSPDDDSIQWRVDDDVRFHSKVDDDSCIQAGHGPSIEDGSLMRIYPCGDTVFQKFDESFVTYGGLSGPIIPVSDPDLCVVRRGVISNVGKDPIILKTCDTLDEDRALGWEADNPSTHGSFIRE